MRVQARRRRCSKRWSTSPNIPTAIRGSFDPQFLELPAEVLITVMRHHQKYFSVEDADGKLAPHFVAVMNTDARSRGPGPAAATSACCARASTTPGSSGRRIRRRSWPTAWRIWRNVTFQAKLGSYLEKTERVVALVKELGGDAHAAARRASSASATSPPKWSRSSPNCKAWSAASTRARRASPKPSGRPSTITTSRSAWKIRFPRTRDGAARRARRQARHAARMLPRRPDSDRLDGSVRAAPRRAGRRQDSGGRQARHSAAATCSAAMQR